MPHSTSRSLVPAFAPDRDVSLAVKLASELALVSPISIRIEPTFERLRYHLGMCVLFQLHIERFLISDFASLRRSDYIIFRFESELRRIVVEGSLPIRLEDFPADCPH